MKKLNKPLSIALLGILAICFLSVGSVFAQVVGSGSIDNGLVGYWRLDEGSGLVAYDSSGVGNDGSITAASYTFGRFESGLNITSSSVVEIPANPVYDTSQPFSVCLWFYPNGAQVNGHRLFEKTYNSISIEVMNDNTINVETSSAISQKTTATFNLDSWNFVCVTINSSHVGVNLNGAFENFALSPAPLEDASANLYIGKYYAGSGFNFDGLVDDVRFYNRVLSNSEISLLYTGVQIHVSYDLGSTVTPNSTNVIHNVYPNPYYTTEPYVLVGVDQSQSFSIGVVSTNFMQSSIYVDGVPYAPSSTFILSGVQADHTVYVTSQFIGNSTNSALWIGLAVFALFTAISLYFTVKPIGTINLIIGISMLAVMAALATGGYLGTFWVLTLFGAVVGVVCMLRGTDLI